MFVPIVAGIALLCGDLGNLGSGATMPPAQAQDPVAFEKSRVALWQSALVDSFKIFKQNIVIDFNKADLPFSPPRIVQPNPREDLGDIKVTDPNTIVDLASYFLHRKKIPLKGGFALARDADYSDSPNARYERTIKWLRQVKSAELSTLLNDGVPFANLSQASKEIFARFCGNRGLQKKMATGDFASAEVRLSFVGIYRNSAGTRSTLLLDLDSRSWQKEVARRDRLQRLYVKPEKPGVESAKVEVGELVFEKGELLQIDELVKRATIAFKRNILFDGRFSNNYCFIQGHFSKDSFLKYLKAISPIIDWEYLKTLEECRDEIIEEIRHTVAPLVNPTMAPKGLSFDQLLQGSQVRGSDMFSSFPYLQLTLMQMKLPEDTIFTLSPALTLQIVGDGADLEPEDPPGSSPIRNSWSMTLGNR